MAIFWTQVEGIYSDIILFLEGLAQLEYSIGEFRKTDLVDSTHPLKTAKGGAASVVVMQPAGL
jgi:hypothetical protein